MNKIKKLTKQELIELVTKIYNFECKTERERSELMQLFAANVPHDNVYELVFGNNATLTPEEVVEKALAHKPVIIELGGPKYTEEELTHKGKK
jgi:hypothetical protein